MSIRGLADSRNIQSLVLSGVRPDSLTWAEICRLPVVETLDVSGTWLSDDELLQINSLPKLRQLHLAGTEVTLEGLVALDRASKLSGAVIDAGLAFKLLAHPSAPHPNFKVSTSDYDFHNGNAKDVSNTELWKQPEQFLSPIAADLSSTHTKDSDLHRLAKFRNIESLSLADTLVTGDGLQFLRGLSKLRTLDLSDCEVTDAQLANLASFPRLEVLNLAHNHITNNGLATLSQLTELRKLDLTLNSRIAGWDHWVDEPSRTISDQGLNRLRTLNKLETLRLGSCGINGDGLKSLRQLSKLANLDLAATMLTQSGMNDLTSLTQLRHLCLDQVPGVGNRLSSLKPLVHLQVLSLHGTVVDEAVLSSVKDMPELRAVYLDDGVLRNLDVEKLHELLPNITFTALPAPEDDVFAFPRR